MTMTLDLTSAAAILALSPSQAGRIFSGVPDFIRRQWRTQARHWHPDRHAGDATASAVFQHLQALRDAALGRFAADSPAAPGELILDTIDGRWFRLRK